MNSWLCLLDPHNTVIVYLPSLSLHIPQFKSMCTDRWVQHLVHSPVLYCISPGRENLSVRPPPHDLRDVRTTFNCTGQHCLLPDFKPTATGRHINLWRDWKYNRICYHQQKPTFRPNYLTLTLWLTDDKQLDVAPGLAVTDGSLACVETLVVDSDSLYGETIPRNIDARICDWSVVIEPSYAGEGSACGCKHSYEQRISPIIYVAYCKLEFIREGIFLLSFANVWNPKKNTTTKNFNGYIVIIVVMNFCKNFQSHPFLHPGPLAFLQTFFNTK